MLRILTDEGYEIKERELMRVRARNRWLLRVPNGTKNSSKRKRGPDQDVIDQLQAALYPDAPGTAGDLEDVDADTLALTTTPPARASTSTRAPSPPLSPQVLAKRQERLEKLQAESAQRWTMRKRRRRTKGWAGLPADPPGPPRFPSETTIEESKIFLRLDSRLYNDVRATFQRICESEGIMKKTLAGAEKWEAAKDQLVQQSPHLQSVFWADKDNQDKKKLALDVICGDVTKRLRTLERRMTIAEAKNALKLNPEQARQLRNSFYQTLKADHFTSKLEAGEEHWKHLKQQWIDASPLLQSLLAPSDADPQLPLKIKAAEVLCRDVMKRLRDDQTKRDPTRKQRLDSSVMPQSSLVDPTFPPSPSSVFTPTENEALVQAAAAASAQAQAQSRPPHLPSQAPPPAAAPAPPATSTDSPHHTPNMVDHSNLQIDPSLLLAAANDPAMLGRTLESQYSEQTYSDAQYAAQAAQAAFPSSPASYAVYFRLHPASDVQTSPRLWVSTLSTVSIEELRHLTQTKFPGTYAIRIEGVIKQPTGHEMMLSIDQDDELEAYMGAIGGVKPIFLVQLVAWKN